MYSPYKLGQSDGLKFPSTMKKTIFHFFFIAILFCHAPGWSQKAVYLDNDAPLEESINDALLNGILKGEWDWDEASTDTFPRPTPQQLAWQQMEQYAFLHFSINTFTDQEWGFGNEPATLFNPKKLDAGQWARTCKAAGLKGIILTAKHHCGFCLWPTRTTEYSVKNSPWRGGKGDVVRELADACRKEGLKFAVYVSPWDRHAASYGSKDYITMFREQLHELLTQYGDIFEVWFDGANGGTGWYGGASSRREIDRRTYYDWGETYRLVRQWQPNCVIWNDGGQRGDLRWVGNEA